MLKDFINSLKENAEYRDILGHYHYLPEKPVEYVAGDAGLSPPVVAALARLGINRLFLTRARPGHIREGKHLLVATPTASGKTLIYNLPVLESLLREPRAHALYLFPLKALEQEKLKTLRELDGALPFPSSRPRPSMTATRPPRPARPSRPSPPMSSSATPTSSLGFLPFHDAGLNSFKNLRFVIIDEVHTYRGIFGSHMAQVLRRSAAHLRPLRLFSAIFDAVGHHR